MKKSGVILSILLIIAAVYVIKVGATRESDNEKKLIISAKEDKNAKETEEARLLSLNFYGNMDEGRDVSALIIGDSIGQSDGSSNANNKWSNLIIKDVKKKHKINITTDLITSSSKTAIRTWVQLNETEITKQYDLAFICLGQDDQFSVKPEQFKIFYENIIIKLKKINPKIEIIPIIESSFRENNDYTKAIQELAKHYNLQYADALQAFNTSGQDYENLTADIVHPNDKGYGYYVTTIEKIIEDNFAVSKKTNVNYSMLYPDTKKLTSYSIDDSVDVNNGFNLEDGMIGKKVGDSITFNTTNSVVIINFLRQPKGGKFKVYIDDNFIEETDTNKASEAIYSNLISDNLQGEHKIKIEISSIDNAGTVKILGLSTN